MIVPHELEDYVEHLKSINYFKRLKKIRNNKIKIYSSKYFIQLIFILIFLIFILFLAYYQKSIDTIYKFCFMLIIILILIVFYNLLMYKYIYPKIGIFELEKNILIHDKSEIDILFPQENINFKFLNNNDYSIQSI